MTVRDNMAFSLTVRKQPKVDVARKVEDAAKMLGLETLLDRYPKQLSGGQRQRVAIGRAIVRRPRVFLFDEPLSNLDANLRAEMRVELKKLHQKLGATMIYVTHDQIEAMTLADRICVLEGGFARQVDTPRNLYERPISRFVAEFIGSPPMNILRVTVKNGMLEGQGVDIPIGEKFAGANLPEMLDIGIRPHELRLDERLPGKITATVEVIETVGWDLHLHARVGEREIIAHVAANELPQVRPGSEITFAVDPSDVKPFDPETQNALVPVE